MADSTETVVTTDENTQPEPTPEPLQTDWKAEARKWEDRAKSNRDAVKRVETLEAELAASQASLADASGKVAKFEAEQQRAGWVGEALTKAGLDAGFGAVLRGDTLEALLEHAEALKSVATPKGTPVPDAGKTPETTTTPEREAARQLFRANP